MRQPNQGEISLLVGCVMILLKLTHVITCSWWWVLFPFWLQLVLIVVVYSAIKYKLTGEEWDL